MKLKYFLILSIILIGGLVGVVYFQNQGATLTVTLFGINLTFPVALWLAGGMGLIFLIGAIGLFLSNMRYSIYRKHLEKELKQLLDWSRELIFYRKVGEPKRLKVLGLMKEFIGNLWGDRLTFNRWENFPYMIDLKQINEGKYVDLSKYKIPFDNPWEVKNGWNLLKKDPSKAGEILKKYKDPALRQEAFKIWAKKAPAPEILKFEYPLTLEIVVAHLDSPELKELIKQAQLNEREQVELARKLYTKKSPEEELELLEPHPIGKAYLAFKYEHLEKGKEIVEEKNIHLFDYFILMRERGIRVEVDQFLATIWNEPLLKQRRPYQIQQLRSSSEPGKGEERAAETSAETPTTSTQ
ncbi:MAG: LapA family protein [Campylobacterales bacterium]